jgi:Ricin-type beta-trefoil lectin domain-like
VNRPRGERLISRCRLSAPLVVVAALLAGAAAGAAAATAAPLVRVHVPRLVSGHLPLDVRLAPGARLAQVAVDRRNVTGRLRGRSRVLRARLPRRLLRRGPNHVSVVVRDGRGRPVTVTRRSFLLAAGLRASPGPLADAGPDVGGVARRPIRLDGSGSLARGGRRLSYTWRIVRAPRGSHPRLQNRHRRRARLIARRAGRYRLALTVTRRRGGRRLRSRDFADAEVSPAMTPQGLRVDIKPSTGISFTAPDGSRTDYDWNWQGDSGHAHMLVLDRTTLQEVRYTLPADKTIDSTLDANLQPYLPDRTSSLFLVVLAGAPGCCDASGSLPKKTGFSYVFVPRRGSADVRTGVSNEGLMAVLGRAGEPGEITGALQPSPDRASGRLRSTLFSFTQTDVLPYDTNASADPAAGRTLLIQSIGTSMVVDNPGGSGTLGQAMQMYTRLDNDNQGWTLTDAGGGYVELVNQASKLCLDASGDGGGAPVVRQAACTGRPGQLWRWDRVKGSESVYSLSPQAAPNLVLTVAGPNPRQPGTGLTLVESTQAPVQCGASPCPARRSGSARRPTTCRRPAGRTAGIGRPSRWSRSIPAATRCRGVPSGST